MKADFATLDRPDVTGNLLADFYDLLPRAAEPSMLDPAVADPAAFSPGFALPELDSDVLGFLSVATARWRPLGEYAGHRMTMLDLTGNPGTGTTKTFASLLIVARAVAYIRRTGEPVVIFSPTSANKGVALRDAVLRAIDAGLVTPSQLRVVVLAPMSCAHKMRASRLSTDEYLRALNPLLLYSGPKAEDVKALGREFVDRHAAALRRDRGINLWFTLELRNYIVADTARAFFEHQVAPVGDTPRVHAHAVSSAFGLLGYHRGREVLEDMGSVDRASRPASLLVQHLGAPDMVVNLRHGDFAETRRPEYRLDPETGLYRQSADIRFPQVTYDPAEVLDPTFYTRAPATSPAMNDLITRHGGDGVVVSLAECVARYPALRLMVDHLPADFRELREWSLVMALTGVLNAIDRGLVEAGREVVVHGSGCYTATDYELPESTVPVRTVDDIAGVLA
ncbi:DUF6002 family protein [Actinocrispum wychmicini]|uniref:Uncharacterized protein n=1 Tax=Actinocrispum wychmicini TaxID=1213861 RepID=A0A4V6NNI8_9PSEU|nr:DUF6002 family protein [Actinocrispum wychmicini]TCO45320.1 hypothetical protein EV192_12184 [Actinocrispum wychmicini]